MYPFVMLAQPFVTKQQRLNMASPIMTVGLIDLHSTESQA
jgi:hypothetical protein